MKILYGVVGEGMGHAIRSKVVLDHLVKEGHEVEIMASGRAVDFLKKQFPAVNRIHGLFMIAEENYIRRGKTFWHNVMKGAVGVPRNIAAYFELVDDFRPDAVISDFESWTYLYAKTHRLPVLSIDNMQVINRCTHSPEILAGERANFEIARAFVKAKLPGCDHYFITTFFHPPIRKDRTSLHPPILRPEVLAAERSSGDHLLVYQTAEGNEGLAAALAATGIECRIYGMRRHISSEEVDGNLRYRPFSEDGFIADLASARAVVAGGGFTLLGEAVYLHKPVLALPLENQFEQTLNARYLEKEGYGMATKTLTEASTIRRFLDQVPRFEEALAGYDQKDNRQLLDALDSKLDQAEAGIL
jgi:uncharacterized protein (TIGR00661 family)